jgi:phosphoglycerate dehydrogenase-like enzyme
MPHVPDGPPRDVILVTSWIEPHLVERIRAAAPEAEVVHEPELLRPPRYPADHSGSPVTRSEEQEAAWRAHLARATILFDFDPTHREDLPDLAPRVRWIQATSAGIGQMVRRLEYARRMPGVTFTTASGVHARPLAEFALLAILSHARRLLPTLRAQAARRWERFAGLELEGRTVLIVGLGSIGSEVARLVRPLGVRVVGVRRRPDTPRAAGQAVDAVLGPDRLRDLLPTADYLVLTLPHTDETEAFIGDGELAALPDGAVLINIGRGALVDEEALVDALRSGRLGGAFLDVFAEEPLPPESPLWDLPDVVVSPHSASTSEGENERIVALFCENLRRDRAGEPLLNVLDVDRLY